MNSLSSITKKLEARLIRQNFHGYDPHDALINHQLKKGNLSEDLNVCT